MKAIILEDEKLSAEHLINLLVKIDPEIQIIASFDSVKKSIEAFKENPKADLIFVDIHLADGISFEIFSKVAVDIPVIFTTAYNEYAIKAFKLNSIDYLLKPIGIDDLKGAIDKFKKLNFSQPAQLLENISSVYQSMIKQFKSRFMVKIGDTISSIKTEDILHFMYEDGMVMLSTNVSKRYTIDYTLDHLETLIDPSIFFRINRRVLININSIKKVSSYFNSRLKVTTDFLQEEDCIVSRERVSDFKMWLDK
jgi:DNA-binding LytR/AlgR family response regulator